MQTPGCTAGTEDPLHGGRDQTETSGTRTKRDHSAERGQASLYCEHVSRFCFLLSPVRSLETGKHCSAGYDWWSNCCFQREEVQAAIKKVCRLKRMSGKESVIEGNENVPLLYNRAIQLIIAMKFQHLFSAMDNYGFNVNSVSGSGAEGTRQEFICCWNSWPVVSFSLIWGQLADFPAPPAAFMLQKLCALWNTCTANTSFTETSNQRTFSWIARVIWRLPTLDSPKNLQTGKTMFERLIAGRIVNKKLICRILY